MFKLNNTDGWSDVEKLAVTCTSDVLSGLSVSTKSRIEISLVGTKAC